ncbi:outer membrane protein [Microvirga antarctica]|uniref:outer membrane protein n=1 Tax=Microvirga antarctica TaxID=2819233 RepID=UPI001B31401C|nr:outer membrane beta-barrel protein [Microvirga antarctica]
MRLPILALAALTLGLAVSPAAAADLPPAPILDDEDEALGSGWYLRGDVGAVSAIASRRSRDPGDGLFSSLVNGKLGDSAMLGVGVGYQVSPWFRTDVTVDHRFEAAFKGTRLSALGTVAHDRYEADSTTLLLNGYIDLPLWSGITPYLGAGIGISRISFSTSERFIGGRGSQADTVLAWALMGGVAFDITTQLKIDLGYRYTRATTTEFAATMPVQPRQSGAHEFRIGARYLFD